MPKNITEMMAKRLIDKSDAKDKQFMMKFVKS